MRFQAMILTGLMALSFCTGHAQKGNQLFQKTATALQELSVIRYDSYREINNFRDNYFSKNTGTAYFEFDRSREGELLRCQLRSKTALQVYNGTELFSLYAADSSFEGGKSNADALSNLSLLYNSMATLRISLPVIAADPSVQKSVSDTLVDGKKYHLLKFSFDKKGLGFPSGFTYFDAEVTRYYELLTDPATDLPFMILDRNSIMKDQYFTKTVFSDIRLQPSRPAPDSWFLSSYTGYAPKTRPSQKPMVRTGNLLPSFTLATMDPLKTDSLSSTSLKGKKTMLEFWIKNCGYCMAAFPDMKALQKEYGAAVNIVSVNAYEEREDVEFFYKREQPAYRMLYNGEKLANSLGIYGYPSVIIVDEKGKVVYAKAGFNRQEVEKVLHP